MTANSLQKKTVSFRSAIFLALLGGIFGLAILFLPDMDLVTFFECGAAMVLLFSGDQYFTEGDQKRIRQTLKTAFAWQFLAVLIVFAFFEATKWLNIPGGGAAYFINRHWPALMAASMCILAGVSGLRWMAKEPDGRER